MPVRPTVARVPDLWSESTSRTLGLEGGAGHFDYGAVSSSVGSFLRGQAERIRRQCVTSIIQIGKALRESKRHLSHGLFVHWIEAEVRIPVRTAQAYMRVAEWAEDKGAAVSQLSPSVLYLLSAAKTPREFVTDIMRRAESGERVAPAAVKAELKRFRAAGREHSTVQFVGPRELSGLQMATQGLGEASGVEKLVALLIEALTAEDFRRVCELVLSDVIISDPRLAENLRRAFLVRMPELKGDMFLRKRRRARH